MTEKRCPRCTHPFPTTSEYFHKNISQLDGLCHYCKACQLQIGNISRNKCRERIGKAVSVGVRLKDEMQTSGPVPCECGKICLPRKFYCSPECKAFYTYKACCLMFDIAAVAGVTVKGVATNAI